MAVADQVLDARRVGRPVTVVREPDLVALGAKLRRRGERHKIEADELRAERAAAIIRMKAAGYGFEVIGRHLGISKTLAQQLYDAAAPKPAARGRRHR